MKGLIIQATNMAIYAEFGDYSNDKASWLKSTLKQVWFDSANDIVKVSLDTGDGYEFVVAHKDGCYQVDQVNGISPNDAEHLYNLIKDMQG